MILKNKQFENSNVTTEELWQALYNENPLHETHDFYGFLYSDGFKDIGSGNYRKVLDIEVMVKLTYEKGYKILNSMTLRSKYAIKNIGTIWWPKESIDLIDSKSTSDMDFYIIELIEKHMNKRNDGLSIYKKVKDRLQKRKDFNL